MIDGTNGTSPSSSIQVYDTTLNTWQTDSATDLVSRDGVASAVDLAGNIYLIGGFNGSSVLSVVTEFNPASGTVVALPSMLTPRAFAAAATGSDGKIYVFGGESSTGVALSSAEVFDPVSHSWTPTASLPQGVIGASAVADGTTIYVIGGNNSLGVPSSAVFAFNTVPIRRFRWLPCRRPSLMRLPALWMARSWSPAVSEAAAAT